MQNNIFKNAEAGKRRSAITNSAQDRTLQDELMQELAQRKTSLENLTGENADESNSLLTGAVQASADTAVTMSSSTLRNYVEQTLHSYFAHLDGQPVTNIYDMVLAEVEAPLLEVVMRNAMGNQCRAAELLGLSRGTLRKKLQQYGLL